MSEYKGRIVLGICLNVATFFWLTSFLRANWSQQSFVVPGELVRNENSGEEKRSQVSDIFMHPRCGVAAPMDSDICLHLLDESFENSMRLLVLPRCPNRVRNTPVMLLFLDGEPSTRVTSFFPKTSNVTVTLVEAHVDDQFPPVWHYRHHNLCQWDGQGFLPRKLGWTHDLLSWRALGSCILWYWLRWTRPPWSLFQDFPIC